MWHGTHQPSDASVHRSNLSAGGAGAAQQFSSEQLAGAPDRGRITVFLGVRTRFLEPGASGVAGRVSTAGRAACVSTAGIAGRVSAAGVTARERAAGVVVGVAATTGIARSGECVSRRTEQPCECQRSGCGGSTQDHPQSHCLVSHHGHPRSWSHSSRPGPAEPACERLNRVYVTQITPDNYAGKPDSVRMPTSDRWSAKARTVLVWLAALITRPVA